jgi:hypothetical protein
VFAASHCECAQQGSSSPPQALQVPELHARSGCGQVAPAQHGSASPPHGTQRVPLHTPPTSQPPPRQQGWSRPPQAVQAPLSHASVSAQRPSAQQGWSSAPQRSHWFGALQTRPAAHCSPLARHVFASGSRTSQHPVLHASPGQQGWPSPPQPEHMPVFSHESPR